MDLQNFLNVAFRSISWCNYPVKLPLKNEQSLLLLLSSFSLWYIPKSNSCIYLIGDMNAKMFVAEPCTTAKLYKQPNNPQQENGYHNHTVEYYIVIRTNGLQ